MGNRAYVIFKEKKEFSPAIYLHWNGSRDSVEPLLKQARELMSGRSNDLSYVSARFTGICHNFFDGNLSLGIENSFNTLEKNKKSFQPGDNGCYIVDIQQSDWLVKQYNEDYNSAQLKVKLVDKFEV